MDTIIVLDFGGQYAHLIANRIRRLGCYTEIYPAETSAQALKHAKGIILSGGPSSVFEPGSPDLDPSIFKLGIPILGLCYGHQLIAKHFHAKVQSGTIKEYGKAALSVLPSPLFQGLSSHEQVWMSHGDSVVIAPFGFSVIGKTDSCEIAAMEHPNLKIYGLQFHPEVTHTPCGNIIFQNFISITGCKPDWSIDRFIENKTSELVKIKKKVFLLVSGGVDSAVAYALLGKTLGHTQVLGVHIDNGLMRKGESQGVVVTFQKLGLSLQFIDASSDFIHALSGVVDPEEKRRIIGEVFVRTAQKALEKLNPNEWVLAQGTIYPDTIESKGTKHASLIKTHHNRVPLMQALIDRGEVIEPLAQLYKDEVRELGRQLGLPDHIVNRQPFPGPGLGVRCLCSNAEIKEYLHPDTIKLNEMVTPLSGVIAPIKSVGVQGDSRSYRHPAIVFGDATWEQLDKLSSLPNSLPSINRIIYLLTPTLDLTLLSASITRARLDLLREADLIVNQFMEQEKLWGDIWQFPIVLAPLGAHESIILRPVHSTEAMTANYANLPLVKMRFLAVRLMTLGISAVYYDFTTKPPATIEWE